MKADCYQWQKKALPQFEKASENNNPYYASQYDFAKKITEKVSVVHKMETGSFEPSLKLARKLQKVLGVRLIVVEEVEEFKPKSESSGGMTLGDMLKKK